MTEEEVIDALRSAPFKFAKTMPNNPHFYTLRDRWGDDEKFEIVVQFIRDHGKPERFFSREYIYYYLDGYKYWTMGDTLPGTILINRADA